jgi:hypothetical protein
MVGLIDEEGTRATDDTTITIANAREPIDTRKGARAAVIVIDSDDEDFVRREEVPIRAAEGDNRDELVSVPEKESRATAVDIDSDDELLVGSIRHSRALGSVSTPEDDVAAAGIVNDSDDEVLLPSSRRHINVIEVESSDESDGDADYIPSSEDVSSDDEGGSSTVGTVVNDVEHDKARQPIVVEVTTRPRKRKVRPTPVQYIGSDDNPYEPSSPRFERSPKRQQRSPRFEDSGVVMPPSSDPRYRSSADSVFIITSSPPIMCRSIRSQPEEEDSVRGAGRAAVPVTHDNEIPQGTVPSPVPFVFGRRQPTTDALEEHLETWCQACPACVTVTGVEKVMHHIEDCWRAGTDEIVKHAHAAQQFIDKHGGFGGRHGCARCGVPRTICQRWQARPDGDGWDEVAGAACQYEKRLAAAVMTMLMDGCPEGLEIATSWMSDAGVVPSNNKDVYEWFRGPTWWPGTVMEVSRMVRVFHVLAAKNRMVMRR